MDIVIAGAGAAGLFCAGLLGQKGHRVTVIEGGVSPARKLLLTGGGKCNFTNMDLSAEHFLSANPHFCKSALSRYTQYDFLVLLERYAIPWEERVHGRLFCVTSARDIVDMLLTECRSGGVRITCGSVLESAVYKDTRFDIKLSTGEITADKLIIATGGLSLPKTGATPIGYRIAESFGVPVTPVRAGLVPLTLDKPLLDALTPLSGISLPALVTAESGHSFKEELLFTHRGLSGPVILQISNYWNAGQSITVNLLPNLDVEAVLIAEQQQNPNRSVKNTIAKYLPRSLCESLCLLGHLPDISMHSLTVEGRGRLVDALTRWKIRPSGTEGYRTAEVTLGGIDTGHLSSRTMAAKTCEHLYFIGEAVDVTGQLGGYNLHWCWSSAWACAEGIPSLR